MSCKCNECHEHHGHHEHHGENGRLTAVRLILGAVLYVAGLLSDADALYLVSYIVLGYDVLFEAVKDIRHIFNENFLMSLASIGAIAIGEYPEAAAVMLFYQIGEALSDYAVGRSQKSIGALMDLRADTAKVLRGGSFTEVPCENVEIGETILVSSGERVPLDGIISEGGAMFDTSALTGEAAPVYRSVSDEIASGVINTDSAVKIRVTKSFSNSTVSKILELVNNENKSNPEKFITKFAKVYTPIVVLAAFVIAFIVPVFAGDFREHIYTALLFLVVSCPCALVVSVPLTFFAGIGCASKNGILVKGAYALERFSEAKNIAFDKTGTLTEGKFSVREIRVANGAKQELLEYAAYAEFYSPHPIARAITAAYGKPVDEARVSEYKEHAGRGVTAVVDGRKIAVGSRGLMLSQGIDCPEQTDGNCIYVAADGVFFGTLTVRDSIKSNAAAAVKRLSELKINSEILTGDTRENAAQTAGELKLAFHSELLPQDKVTVLEQIKENGCTAFVGDGINDAPVLSHSDVGISMGGLGADAAIEASDIVIMTDDLEKIPLGLCIARKTMKIARENIVFSLAVKLAIMVLGVMQFATMWLAVFADVGVCLLAVLNSLRAFRVKNR